MIHYYIRTRLLKKQMHNLQNKKTVMHILSDEENYMLKVNVARLYQKVGKIVSLQLEKTETNHTSESPTITAGLSL